MSAHQKRQRVDDDVAAPTTHCPSHPQQPRAASSTSDIDFSTYHRVIEPLHSLSPSHPPPLPLHMWGFDPLFFSACKLLIAHILTLPAFPSLPASTTLHGRPVVRCEVVGVVVGRIVKESFTVLHVDDSSGVLRCKVWTADSELKQLAAEARLGACVRCVGRLHEWQGVRELNMEWLRLECDSVAEMLHWMECMRLYDDCYRRPSVIMQRQQQQQQQRDVVT